jgi:CubicO group peptidase (beta-lactamase class C family)
MYYSSPEEAGYSSRLLNVAYEYYKLIDSSALMVIHDGAVLAAWGEIDRKFMCHSVRKSLLNSLYGIYVNEGDLDLNKTMEELGIDDDPPLTYEEKQAKVIHLIKARSGVYHEAAYESAGMKAARPERGSHAPDTFWYYNNWDFNTLGTIFEQETGIGIFDAFEKRIADVIGMEDFVKEEDTYYHYELQYSIHPAYPFEMTARDLARFGYLFLRRGNWNGQQIFPESWVDESVYPYSIDSNVYGYGYMWWIVLHPAFDDLKIYHASGYGGHAIFVIPGADMVIVNRVNTYDGVSNINGIQNLILVGLITRSKIGPPNPNADLHPLDRIRK